MSVTFKDIMDRFQKFYQDDKFIIDFTNACLTELDGAEHDTTENFINSFFVHSVWLYFIYFWINELKSNNVAFIDNMFSDYLDYRDQLHLKFVTKGYFNAAKCSDMVKSIGCYGCIVTMIDDKTPKLIIFCDPDKYIKHQDYFKKLLHEFKSFFYNEIECEYVYFEYQAKYQLDQLKTTFFGDFNVKRTWEDLQKYTWDELAAMWTWVEMGRNYDLSPLSDNTDKYILNSDITKTNQELQDEGYSNGILHMMTKEKGIDYYSGTGGYWEDLKHYSWEELDEMKL